MNKNSGFTLLELILVIAILSFLTVIGIKSYGNLKYREAKKMNVIKMKQLAHQVAIYDLVKEDSSDNNNAAAASRFANLESLLENAGKTSDPMLTDASKAGTFDWTPVEDGNCLIYDGTWRQENAPSDKSQTVNKGITTSLAGKIGVYYLTAAEAELLRDIGIPQVLVHAGTPKRAAAYTGDIKNAQFGGGPTWRPDMSATYPMAVSNGTPVVVLKPTAQSTMTGYIYEHFDCGLFSDIDDYANVTYSGNDCPALATTKIVLFGLGRYCTMCKSSMGLDEVPICPAYDKFHYRNYLLAFSIKIGGQGRQSAARFIGVLDPDGNDLQGAEYNVTWQISEN